MSTRTTKSGRAQSPAATSGKKPTAGKKGRKSIAPVRVGKERNWGPIALFTLVGVIAAGIIGWAAWAVASQQSWDDEAAGIEDIVNYREADNAEELLAGQHVGGVVEYEILPPVGGNHNDFWQNCTGIVYDAPIANEHAVHSLEHGAIWIAYRPDLPADQVADLASRVEGRDYTMMSPYEGLDAPISLQAWGYQLKVDSADDPRIDDFIRTLRVNASMEPGATCGGPNSVSTTGTVPTSPAGA